jgi:peroxiredoxin Q/BCP
LAEGAGAFAFQASAQWYEGPVTLRAKLLLAVGGACVAVAASLFSCGAVKRPDGGAGLLPVGASAPDLEGRDAQGRVIHLSDVRGQRAVVYFYPSDETPGCTKEACAFRDAFARYGAAHVTIFGVSQNDAQTHADFAAHHRLPFPLVADPGGAVARAYGVGSTLGMDARVSFLVGPDGHVERVWPNVDPAVHADEVLAAAQTR